MSGHVGVQINICHSVSTGTLPNGRCLARALRGSHVAEVLARAPSIVAKLNCQLSCPESRTRLIKEACLVAKRDYTSLGEPDQRDACASMEDLRLLTTKASEK